MRFFVFLSKSKPDWADNDSSRGIWSGKWHDLQTLAARSGPFPQCPIRGKLFVRLELQEFPFFTCGLASNIGLRPGPMDIGVFMAVTQEQRSKLIKDFSAQCDRFWFTRSTNCIVNSANQ